MRISVRRLAREWALKVLYQYDVGDGDLHEVLMTAMDHLRQDFVHLGSRTSSGSPFEEVCLDVLTQPLLPRLPHFHLALARLYAFVAAALLGEAPWWQEQLLEKSLRNKLPSGVLQPSYLLSALPKRAFLPPPGHPLEADYEALTFQEKADLEQFLQEMRENLPRHLESLMRGIARQEAKRILDSLPSSASPEETRNLLLTQREEFNRQQIARWRRIADTVRHYLELWLRTAPFATQLVLDVSQNRNQLDTAIGETAVGWRLERLVAVDRNILRIGACELLIRRELPAAVIINEAVELAKKYSTADSGRFVNGVLSAMAEKLATTPTPSPHLMEQEETLIEMEMDGKDES
jgi:transcription antitermination factor NusB